MRPPSGSDDHAARASVVGDIEFPSTSGTVTGWIGLVLVALGLFFVVSQQSGIVVARGVLGLLLFGVLVYAYLMRPRVWVRDDELVLVNPLSTTQVPLGRISYVSVRSVTKVSVGEKRYSGVGVGRKVRDMARLTDSGFTPSSPGTFLTMGQMSADAKAGTAETADMLEDVVSRAVLQVRGTVREGHEPPPVRRAWARSVVLPALLLAVALAVTLLL